MYKWDYCYGFASSMVHLKSDLVGLLIVDGMWQYSGHGIVLRVPRDNTNPTKNELRAWINHMELNYDMILLLQHIRYLYSIHDGIVK
jgi:hypothetical protein